MVVKDCSKILNATFNKKIRITIAVEKKIQKCNLFMKLRIVWRNMKGSLYQRYYSANFKTFRRKTKETGSKTSE